MTKQEINLAIANLKYPELQFRLDKRTKARYWAMDGEHFEGFTVDYCKNWNDLMPLVVELEIDFQSDGEYWVSDYYGFDHPVTVLDKDPKLALAKCVLKVLQEQDDDF